jgi:hypothetical protein
VPDSPCDPAIPYACTILGRDAKLITSPLTKGFVGDFEEFYFPFLACAYTVYLVLFSG